MAGPVERITLTHLQIPLKEPHQSPGETAIKEAILVTVESQGGLGLGECSLSTASSGPSQDRKPPPGPDAIWNELTDRLVPAVLGQSFDSIEALQVLFSNLTVAPSARVGIETACWDLLGQLRHASLAELMGASLKESNPCVESGLCLGLYPTVVELLKVIETHLVEGFRRVKIDIEPGRDVELVHAVRQHFGEIPLMVDARGAYSSADIEVFRALDDLDLLMIEQPMAPADLAGSAALQEVIATPVGLDESARTRTQVEAALRCGAGRAVCLKLQCVGGYGPALELHELCRRSDVPCWVGTMPEFGIGQAHGIHLAALGNCRYPTDLGPSARWFVDDYAAPSLEMASPGHLRIPSRPGLGFQLNHAKVRRYQVRQAEFKERNSVVG